MKKNRWSGSGAPLETSKVSSAKSSSSPVFVSHSEHVSGLRRPVHAKPLPFVTIVMPALNEEKFISDAIDSLLPSSDDIDYELIVVDGGSDDRTAEIVNRRSQDNFRIRLLFNKHRIQAAALNLAAGVADPRAQIILRADCHALYPPGFVEHCVETLSKLRVASVVVPMHAEGKTWFQKAIAYAQNSKLGNGGAAHRKKGSSGYVDHGHHAAFDRDVFATLGGYDVSFSHNEDAELDYRIRRAGHKIFLTGEPTITYYPRTNLSALSRQYFHYGKGRAQTLTKHQTVPRLRQLFPVLVCLICLFAALWSLVDTRAMFIPIAYILLCLFGGIVIAVRKRAVSAIASGLAAITMHMSWAFGFIFFLLTSTANLLPYKVGAHQNTEV